MKKFFKYLYLTLGIIHYLVVNYISYNVSPYNESLNIYVKILFSLISLIILTILYFLVVIKDFNENSKYNINFKKETLFIIYVLILIVPLISLAY